MENKVMGVGLTFDDVLLVPQYSEVTPDMIELETRLSKHIHIHVPLMSAAMDTVTESKMAIALALLGGVGVIHKNLTIEAQAAEIKAVKDYPVDQTRYPLANLDSKGRLLVGASLGITLDRQKRAEALLKEGADFFVLDSAHGDSKNVIEALKDCKAHYSVDIIAGNVATYEGAKHLMEAGADAVKVGMGPGSICTTRIVSGMGVPQITAIFEAVKAKEEFDCPIIADGGIVYSGDIAKAIGAGADSVMLGKIFASCPEAPGEAVEIDGKTYKSYRGMGSIGAMDQAHGSSDRYFQSGKKKFVPEGVEALVPLGPSVEELIYELLGGLRSGMGYLGAKSIEDMQKKATFVQITNASLRESHPHDVKIAKEAPNYKEPK